MPRFDETLLKVERLLQGLVEAAVALKMKIGLSYLYLACIFEKLA